MANDYTALQAAVVADLARADLSATVVPDAILDAIREYEGHRFYFNEQLLTLTLSATNTYALSLFASTASLTVVDIIEVDSFRVNIGTSRSFTLSEQPWSYINDIDSNVAGTPGYPDIFSYWAQSIRVYPIPSATIAMTGTISAHVKFKELSAGADSNPWTNDAKHLIRAAAARIVAQRYIRDETVYVGTDNAEQRALAGLQRRTEALSGSRLRSFL